MEEQLLKTLHIIVSGRVQGVFFRTTTQMHAICHHITGTVRNREDGSVEIFATGQKDDLEAFIASIKSNPGNGYIDQFLIMYSSEVTSFQGFQIIS